MACILKGLYTVGKRSVNAFIPYENQERCIATNLWKSQIRSAQEEEFERIDDMNSNHNLY